MGECLTFFFYSFKSHLLLVQVILNHLFVLCCHSFSQECLLGTLNSKNSCKWDVGTRILKDTKIQNSLYLMTKPAFRINQKKKKKPIELESTNAKCHISWKFTILKCPLILYIHMFQYSEIFFFFFNKLAGQWLSWVIRWFFLVAFAVQSQRISCDYTFLWKKKSTWINLSPSPACLLNKDLAMLAEYFYFSSFLIKRNSKDFHLF